MTCREYLDQMAKTWAGMGRVALLERIVLKLGVDGVQAPAGKWKVKRGIQGECYKNASRLATDYRRGPKVKGFGKELIGMPFTYCEGFAMKPSIGLAIQHAWVVDKDGAVIDNTWDPEPDISYCGIKFEVRQLMIEQLKIGVFGLLDTGRGLNFDLIKRLDPELIAEAERTMKCSLQ